MDMTDVPDKYRARLKRVLQGHNRPDAVRLHCIMCMGWEVAEVKRCTSTTCPLYAFRCRAPMRHETPLGSTQTAEVVSLGV